MTDFTVSRDIKSDTKLYDSEGTPAFTAPECSIVDSGGYSPKPTDMWSYGVCLYTYVSGKPPFYGEGELEMQIKAMKEEHEALTNFSPQMSDLINRTLEKDPSKRITAKELMTHPWIVE